MFNRDAALYALGIGACASNAVDADELKFVYHEDGQESIKVLFVYHQKSIRILLFLRYSW